MWAISTKATIENNSWQHSMRCDKLRITWSVLCGIACVLLIVAWVRSFSVADRMYIGWRGVPYNAVIVLDPSRLAIELREYDITPGSVANPLFYMRDSQAIPGYQQRRYADGSIPGRQWFRFSPGGQRKTQPCSYRYGFQPSFWRLLECFHGFNGRSDSVSALC
jgi:hypothetical protein